MRQDYDGRVLVVVNGTWRTVCAEGWNETDAGVVCRQLGYGGGNASRLAASSNYTMGLYNVRCMGYESRALDCPHTSYDTSLRCGWGAQEAGVVCHGGTSPTAFPYYTTAPYTGEGTSSPSGPWFLSAVSSAHYILHDRCKFPRSLFPSWTIGFLCYRED